MNPKPKVTIVATTADSPVRAAALLIFTKSTRLVMSPDGFTDILKRCKDDWPWALSELEYMSRTIRSSWEFLDVTFLIQNVSRACAQQMTRTRLASYAMQSQRVTDLSGATFHDPFDARGNGDSDKAWAFRHSCGAAITEYENLVNNGMKPEDARGVLPMNVHCNLVAKYNLRTLVDLIGARTSYRVQGEYRDVAEQMRDQITNQWPWVEIFLRPRNQIACDLLDELVGKLDAVPNEYDRKPLEMLVAKVKDQLEGH